MENITHSYTKTITLSNEQLSQVIDSLKSRIRVLMLIVDHDEKHGLNAKVSRDKIKIEALKQALAAVEA